MHVANIQFAHILTSLIINNDTIIIIIIIIIIINKMEDYLARLWCLVLKISLTPLSVLKRC